MTIPRLGLILPTFPQGEQRRWSVLGRLAAEAEAAGADSIWAADHLFWHGATLDPFVALAMAASSTTRCTLGTNVLQLPLRPQTSWIAKSAASLQAVSSGRFVLGLGVGVHKGEYRAAGASYRSRGRHLDAAIDELRLLWHDSPEQYAQRPVPTSLPVWIGGRSDAARRRAARTGDGWMPLFVPPHRLAESFELLAEETAAAGRAPSSVTRALTAFLSVGPLAEARTRGTSWMSSLYRAEAAPFARYLIAGEPDACAEAIHEFGEAGVEHLILFVADDDPLPQFARVAEALNPARMALSV